jgi:hypothetical protein
MDLVQVEIAAVRSYGARREVVGARNRDRTTVDRSPHGDKGKAKIPTLPRIDVYRCLFFSDGHKDSIDPILVGWKGGFVPFSPELGADVSGDGRQDIERLIKMECEIRSSFGHFCSFYRKTVTRNYFSIPIYDAIDGHWHDYLL